MISGDVNGPVSNMGNNNHGVIAGTVHIENLVQSNKSTQESLSQRYLENKWPRSLKAAYNANLGGTVTRESCTPGTRIKTLKRIYGWAEDLSSNSPPVFWLTSEAGSGKSTIAYTVACHFDGQEDAQKILGAHFFCSRQFEETRKKANLIPTIVDQLARSSQPYANALLKADKFDSVNFMAKQMKDLLIDPWIRSMSDDHAELPPFLVVIDALDEIEDRGGLAFLEELLRVTNLSHLQGLKFFITSRPDIDLARLHTSDPTCVLYDVPRDTVKVDIETYLQAKLPKLRGTPEINDLMHQADGLFIFAATAVRHTTSRPGLTKKEQIQLLGKLGIGSNVSRNSDASPIDALYKHVMFTAFRDLDDNLLQDRLYALHTLLCTQERVTTSVAGELQFGDPDMGELVEQVVDNLRAVFYVKDNRVLWYHASFPDFIFSQKRSGNVLLRSDSPPVDMHCEEAALHAHLARSCFRIMKSHLRFNICDLPSSFLLDSEVPDLNHRIQAKIGDSLRYSCLHWTWHLARISSNDGRGEFRDFLQLKVLFWIEAMNLMGSRALCTLMLQQAREHILKGDGSHVSDLAREVGEAANFATYFGGSLASQSTPHLYISSLATWWRDSILYRTWKKQFFHVPAFVRTGGEDSLPLLTIWAEKNVISAAFSSDGTRIVSGSWDKSVRVWDASTGAELKRLDGHFESVQSVAFSNDGTHIVSGSDDKSVRVWNASTGEELKKLDGHSDSVHSVAFSRKGTCIVSGSWDNSVRVWNASTGAELRKLDGHSDRVQSVAFSNDETRIVSGSRDESVRVWDASTGTELKRLNGHSARVHSVAFSNDGTYIVSGSYDKSVRVWNASRDEEPRRLDGHSGWVHSVAFSNDGTRIVSGSRDKSVRVWDTLTGAELRVLNGHSESVRSVAFSNDDTRIVSCSDDKSLRVWDASTRTELRRPNGHSESVCSVAFSNDGTRIVSGSYDKSVRVWNASTGVELRRLNGHSGWVHSVAFSNDDTRIVSGSWDKSVRVWDASTGAELKKLNGHSDSVRSVAFLSNDTLVSGSFDNSVRVWNALTGEELKKLDGHSDSVHSVAFSRKGSIVSGSWDNSVRVWNASTGAELRKLDGHSDRVQSVAFSNDGTHIVSGSRDKSVRVWNASTGAELRRLDGHSGWVHSVAFSSDGTRIVSGSDDKSVRVWNASTGAEMWSLGGHYGWVHSGAVGARVVSDSDNKSVRDVSTGTELRRTRRPNGHSESVCSVAFSSDGARIISGSYDKSVRVWDASTGAELKRLDGHTNWVHSVASSSGGTRIVSGSRDKSVRLWDVSTGTELRVMNGHSGSVCSVAFSSDDTRIVSGSWDNSVRVWNASTGAELRVMNGHTESVRSVAFSSDGIRIVSGSDDKSVRVWDISSKTEPIGSNNYSFWPFMRYESRGAQAGVELKRLDGHSKSVHSVAFSRDDARIVSGSDDKTVRVWDASTGAELMILDGHSESVHSVAFSNDDTRIVSGSGDKSVRVWDVATGAELRRLNGHSDRVRSVAFSSDGTRVVSGSLDKSVRVWDVVAPINAWELSSHGSWLISPQPHNQRLMWMPQEVVKILNLPYNLLNISSEPSADVQITESRIGPAWVACYTP